LQGDGPGFAQELAVGVKDNGALLSLNLAENNLGELVLPEGWQRTGGKEWTHSDGAKVTENPGKPEGIIAIANALPDMGALSVLSLKDNKLLTKDGGKALAQALASSSTLKELDVCSNNWMKYGTSGVWMGNGPGFAQELAVGIKDNGALSQFIFSGDENDNTVTMQTSMTDADFSGQGLGVSGAIMVAAFLPKCM
jgi:hypothetical protein